MLIQPPDAMDEVMLAGKDFAESCPFIEKVVSKNTITYNGYEKSFWGRRRVICTMIIERITDTKFIEYDCCDNNYFTVSVYRGDKKIKEQITNYKFANDAYITQIKNLYSAYGVGNEHVSSLLNLYGYVIKDLELIIDK